MCQWNTSEVVALPLEIDPSKEVRSVSLDRCIVSAIKALWESKFQTRSCCCGHDKGPPSLVIANGYKQNDFEAIGEILRRVDGRRWEIMQWQLTKVN